ncbi:uncharacterized protein [Asterias amurensis]|uniref:uncharacterized protein n=1 Tax=Asterias amurensis TaxID=7602 RepID=UPI003AB4F2BB
MSLFVKLSRGNVSKLSLMKLSRPSSKLPWQLYQLPVHRSKSRQSVGSRKESAFITGRDAQPLWIKIKTMSVEPINTLSNQSTLLKIKIQTESVGSRKESAFISGRDAQPLWIKIKTMSVEPINASSNQSTLLKIKFQSEKVGSLKESAAITGRDAQPCCILCNYLYIIGM